MILWEKGLPLLWKPGFLFGISVGCCELTGCLFQQNNASSYLPCEILMRYKVPVKNWNQFLITGEAHFLLSSPWKADLSKSIWCCTTRGSSHMYSLVWQMSRNLAYCAQRPTSWIQTTDWELVQTEKRVWCISRWLTVFRQSYRWVASKCNHSCSCF